MIGSTIDFIIRAVTSVPKVALKARDAISSEIRHDGEAQSMLALFIGVVAVILGVLTHIFGFENIMNGTFGIAWIVFVLSSLYNLVKTIALPDYEPTDDEEILKQRSKAPFLWVEVPATGLLTFLVLFVLSVVGWITLAPVF